MEFIKVKNTYRKNAIVQQTMAKKLMDITVKTCGNFYPSVFEIGAGTGFLTDEITKEIKYDSLYLNDLTPNYTNLSSCTYIKGDILNVNMPDCMNLITSNAVFQWIDDTDKLFDKIKKSLDKKNGILAFSAFGRNNYKQIKDLTGFGLLYPDYTTILKEKGFKILYTEEEFCTLYFENAKKVLEHIKSTGVTTFKGPLWTPRKFESFKKKYLEKYSDANGFELTYHPLYFIAKL